MAVTVSIQTSTSLGPSTRKLTINGTTILIGEFRQQNGCYVKKEFDLCTVLDIHEEGIKWVPCTDRTKWETTVKAATMHQTTLVLTLVTSGASADDKGRMITCDLGEFIFNVCGEPRYVSQPIIIQNPDYGLVDANINASAWTVASDRATDRCRIAYRTYIEDKVSLAEVNYECGSWSPATEIDIYPGLVPKQNFAFAFDTTNPEQRSLFFSPENGDGYIYQQQFDGKCWREPSLLQGTSTRRLAIEGPKAHRFSKFAATLYAQDTCGCETAPEEKHSHGMILLYYVDESNGLQEIVGVKNCKGCYIWTRTDLLEQEVLPNGFLAVAQNGKTTYVLFRNAERALCLLVGTRSENGLKAEWEKTLVLRDPSQIGKNSPIAIAVRRPGPCEPPRITVFYLQRQGVSKYIFALDINPDTFNIAVPCICSELKPRRIGKLEPSSILGAASFLKDKADARFFSVSNLDGDNVLLERVPRRTVTCFGGVEYWAIPSGIVDTDVDHL